MQTKASNIKESNNRASANVVSEKQSDGEDALLSESSSPLTIAQRKLQDMANNSPQVLQARQLQTMADAYVSNKKNIQRRENNTGLPDNLKSGIENLSGYSLNDVKVHYNSEKPSQLQAHAYAQDTDIHVASGQEKHLPHEAWHVVQQKQGRVQATTQMKGGTMVNDDLSLENEADVMGSKALQRFQIANRSRPSQGGENPGSLSVNKAFSTAVIQKAPIDITGGVQVKPGPPPTIHDGTWYYKVFGTRAPADAMAAEWDAVELAGIITPVHSVVQVTVAAGVRWAFRAKEAPGTFFQFSKGGHTGRVTAWINKQTDKVKLGRLRNTFDYVANSIGDGQGFFEDTDGGDLKFIDINRGGTTPNANTIVQDIDARILALP